MSVINKTVEKAKSETTAIISILTEPCRKSKKDSNANEIIYSIHMSFVGATILPPFLPCIRDTASMKRRKRILKNLNELSKLYIDSYRNSTLTLQESQRIMSELEEIGEDIAGYLNNFTPILKVISKMNVQNIIIHTDDFAIPWTWAYFPLDIEQIEFDGPVTDFLCNRYPCGTLIVDTQEGSLYRLKKFWEDLRNKSTDEVLLNTFEISLFQGDLMGEECLKKERSTYLENLETILEKRFEENNIHSFTQSDWKEYSGDSENFTDRFLAGNMRRSKIVHYLGHVQDGALKFDGNTSTYPNDLNDCLYYFKQNPLVVLHGCSSGKIVDIKKKDKQLPTVFLEKGASGCVVALLPVSIPIYKETRAETMIDIFYRKVVVDMKPYGQALYEARREFQRQEETKHDPQWLFFHLYGDPRAMLITTSGKGHLRRFAHFEELIEQEEASKTEPPAKEVCIRLCYSEDLLNPNELLKELKNSGYPDVKMERGPIILDELVELAIAFLIFVGKPIIEKYIVDIKETIEGILKKKKKRLKEKKKQTKKNAKIIKIEDTSNSSSIFKLFEAVDNLDVKHK
jgi:hypothetical protein